MDAALVAANVGKVRVKTSIHAFSQDIMPLHGVHNDAEVGRANRFFFLSESVAVSDDTYSVKIDY